MGRNRKRCPASTSDCPRLHHSSAVMEYPKPSSEVSTELAPDQAPKTLSGEKVKELLASLQKAADELLSVFSLQTEKQIKEVTGHDVLLKSQIQQREQDIQRGTEMFLKLHEDIARWTYERMMATASLQELEVLQEKLIKQHLKTEELD